MLWSQLGKQGEIERRPRYPMHWCIHCEVDCRQCPSSAGTAGQRPDGRGCCSSVSCVHLEFQKRRWRSLKGLRLLFILWAARLASQTSFKMFHRKLTSLQGESIPPGPLGLVKCTHELSFTNNIFHEASQQTISAPPERTTQSTWSQDVPQGLKDETLTVRNQLYGKWTKGLEAEYFRMCW